MSTATAVEPKTAIDTIRLLSADAVQKANSGHPGTPMALAPVAYEIYQNHLRYDPDDPDWAGRDRFVLSVGHASMLLYSMIHLTGIKEADGSPALTMEDIKNFRQLGSKTPGHPESHMTTGVEATTGPLGQGVGTSVGIAAAGKFLSAKYGEKLFDYNVYVLCSDGDMMEGIGNEAGSLAGHLGLDNLVWVYDDNKITIEGDTDKAFTENTADRLAALGWNVIHIDDANDIGALRAALGDFKNTTGRPTFINVRSHIAYGAPTMQGNHEAHGSPLGEDEIKGAKKNFGFPEDKKFYIPDGVYEHFQEGFAERGKKCHADWEEAFARSDAQDEIKTMLAGELPKGWDKDLPTFDADEKGVASRKSGGKILNAIAKHVPWFMGGSADLAPSTNTLIDNGGSFQKHSYGDRNMHFGVREHAAMCCVNGMALSHLRPYGASFFVFTDYCRPALRLAAIMQIPSLFIFTHDSVGLGEDGPTHQPIEHLAMMRATPGIHVFRPCDANEVTTCYKAALSENHAPSLMVLTRQNLPTLDRSKYASADGAAKGAYVLAGDESETPDVILMGTGSEIQHLVKAHETLTGDGIKSRVVSMPCFSLFEQQEQAYKDKVLPPEVMARVSMEAATTFGWDKYTGNQGANLGMTSFGESAPLDDVLKHFGFTPDHAVKAAKAQIEKRKG